MEEGELMGAIALIVAILATGVQVHGQEDSHAALLLKVSDRYRALGTTSYKLEVTTEKKLENSRAPGAAPRVTDQHLIEFSADRSRYRYEFRVPELLQMIVSNGERVWKYDSGRKAYTEGAADSAAALGAREVVIAAERLLIGRFASLDKLEAETRGQGNRRVKHGLVDGVCSVVEITPAPHGSQPWSEQLCIDREAATVVTSLFRQKRQGTGSLLSDETHRTYRVFETGVAFPEDHFNFVPPRGSKRVDQMPTSGVGRTQ